MLKSTIETMHRKQKMLKRLSLFLLLPFLQGCGRGPKLLWQAPIASSTPPIVCSGTVYVEGFHAGHPEAGDHLLALDAETGKERWVSADTLKMTSWHQRGRILRSLCVVSSIRSMDCRKVSSFCCTVVRR
jgi:hypothetical protein